MRFFQSFNFLKPGAYFYFILFFSSSVTSNYITTLSLLLFLCSAKEERAQMFWLMPSSVFIFLQSSIISVAALDLFQLCRAERWAGEDISWNSSVLVSFLHLRRRKIKLKWSLKNCASLVIVRSQHERRTNKGLYTYRLSRRHHSTSIEAS